MSQNEFSLTPLEETFKAKAGARGSGGSRELSQWREVKRALMAAIFLSTVVTLWSTLNDSRPAWFLPSLSFVLALLLTVEVERRAKNYAAYQARVSTPPWLSYYEEEAGRLLLALGRERGRMETGLVPDAGVLREATAFVEEARGDLTLSVKDVLLISDRLTLIVREVAEIKKEKAPLPEPH